MTARTMQRRTASILFVNATLVATLAGCGSDAGSGSTGTDTVPSATGPSATEPSATDPSPTDPGPASGAPLAAFTTAEICERLTPEAVGAALGLEVTAAEPGVMDTPQCAYSYSANGTSSNVTVASMRPDDVGSLPASEAFDYVLDINRQVAGATEVEEVNLDVGDGAVRLSGAALHLGVLRVGDRVVTVIVPASDAEGTGVDALIAQMATSFA